MERKRVQVVFTKPSRTKQSFRDACDVKKIIERHRSTGRMPVARGQAQFGDFGVIPDYQEALNVVIRAEQSFAVLPSRVRERFSNDPALLLSFLADDKNREEAEKLGLVKVVNKGLITDPVPPVSGGTEGAPVVGG